MATFTELNLTTNKETKEINFNGNIVNVFQSISALDKYDLILISFEEAKQGYFINSFKLDVFFHLNLVFMYTDIIFSDEERADPLAIYDKLNDSGLLDRIIAAIPEKDYTELQSVIEDLCAQHIEYAPSAAAILSTFVNDLPSQMDAFREVMENFDPEKFTQVVNLATAANGGRNIKTNEEQAPIEMT